jgi:hypothetical protein
VAAEAAAHLGQSHHRLVEVAATPAVLAVAVVLVAARAVMQAAMLVVEHLGRATLAEVQEMTEVLAVAVAQRVAAAVVQVFTLVAEAAAEHRQ